MCCGSESDDEGPENVERPQGDKPAVIPASGGSNPPMNLTGGGDSNPLPGPSSFPVLPPGTALNPSSRKRIRRLYCKTGYDLAVFPNGKVQGVKSSRNKYGEWFLRGENSSDSTVLLLKSFTNENKLNREFDGKWV